MIEKTGKKSNHKNPCRTIPKREVVPPGNGLSGGASSEKTKQERGGAARSIRKPNPCGAVRANEKKNKAHFIFQGKRKHGVLGQTRAEAAIPQGDMRDMELLAKRKTAYHFSQEIERIEGK